MPYQSPWGHDYAWERAVVRKIRDGGAAPEVYALYEGAISHETPERGGILTGVVYHDETEAAERAAKNRGFPREVSARRRKRRRASKRRSNPERKIQAELRRIKRAAEKEERAREHAKWAEETRKRREDYERNRPIEIAERIEHANQENRIMASKWICTVCGGKSYIERKNPGYQITCMSCEKTAWGSHKSLWEVLSK